MTTVREAIQKVDSLHEAWLEERRAISGQINEELSRLKRSEAYRALDRQQRRALYRARYDELHDQLAGGRPDLALRSYELRSGKVTVDVGMICRGIKPCPHCSAMTGMGVIVVRHEDGRSVRFDPALYHYAQAGHPITDADVDGDTLVAIMTDA